MVLIIEYHLPCQKLYSFINQIIIILIQYKIEGNHVSNSIRHVHFRTLHAGCFQGNTYLF
jgi:hypothetical protein